MAVTTLFDSTVAGSAFDGTKTLAQLGLTDTNGVGSIAGGRLILTGGSDGLHTGFVTVAGNSLFGRITVSLTAGVRTAKKFILPIADCMGVRWRLRTRQALGKRMGTSSPAALAA